MLLDFKKYLILGSNFKGVTILKFPKSKGFNLVCGVVITVFLDDFQTLTGIFLGQVQKNHHHHNYHRRYRNFNEFILIQLTCPLSDQSGIIIPKGEVCAISVDKIQIILPGSSHLDKESKDKCFSIWEEKGENQTPSINISCNRDTSTLES
jgi:hypothetical protein